MAPAYQHGKLIKNDESFILQMSKSGTAEFLPDPLQARLNITATKAEK